MSVKYHAVQQDELNYIISIFIQPNTDLIISCGVKFILKDPKNSMSFG